MKPPIPLPELEEDRSSFRVAVWPAARVVYLGALLIFLVLFAPVFMATPKGKAIPSLFSALVVFAVCGLPLSLGYSALVAQIFPMRVEDDGLTGYSFWGRVHTVAWPQIAAVQPTSFCGLKYLKLSTPTSRNLIWLPLFLADREGFKRAVTNFTSEAHPLRKYLEEHT